MHLLAFLAAKESCHQHGGARPREGTGGHDESEMRTRVVETVSKLAGVLSILLGGYLFF